MEHFDGILPLATEVLGDGRGVEECVHDNSADPLSQLFILLGYHTSIYTYIHTYIQHMILISNRAQAGTMNFSRRISIL